jgi:chromosome segregation ATPase
MKTHGFKSLEETQQDIGALQQELNALDLFKQEKTAEKAKIEEVMTALLKQKDDMIRQKEAVLFELEEKQRAMVAESARVEKVLNEQRIELKKAKDEQETIKNYISAEQVVLFEENDKFNKREKDFMAKTIELLVKSKEVKAEVESLEEKRAEIEALKAQSEQSRMTSEKKIVELELKKAQLADIEARVKKGEKDVEDIRNQIQLEKENIGIKTGFYLNKVKELEVREANFDQRNEIINKKEAELAIKEKNLQDKENGIIAQEREVRIREGLCSEAERMNILKAKGINLQ